MYPSGLKETKTSAGPRFNNTTRSGAVELFENFISTDKVNHVMAHF